MARPTRSRLLLLLLCALPVLLSACALRALFGNVIIVEDVAEDVNEIITTVFSDSTAAVCLGTEFGFFECTYIVDGDVLTSTLYLLSKFGITGVLIDPAILQVPEDVAGVAATYDLGDGPDALSIGHAQAFYATPDTPITAEPGTKFFILELPAAVAATLPEGDPELGLPITYTVSFTRVQPIGDPIDPVLIKAMLAGKVTVNEHHYYVPMLPCVTDFAAIPAIEIPQAAAPVDLQPAVGDLIRNGGPNVVCDHEAYIFNNVPPPPLKVHLPLIR
jgi:hypothetical protein